MTDAIMNLEIFKKKGERKIFFTWNFINWKTLFRVSDVELKSVRRKLGIRDMHKLLLKLCGETSGKNSWFS